MEENPLVFWGSTSLLVIGLIFIFLGIQYYENNIQVYVEFLALGTTITSIAFAILMWFVGKFNDKYYGYISDLKKINSFCKIWLEKLDTESLKWGNELFWLIYQHNRSINAYVNLPLKSNDEVERLFNQKRWLMPHEFYSLEEGIINRMPERVGKINLKIYVDKLIVIDKKIKHLNFIIKKLHFREKLSRQEIDDIAGLISEENPTGIILTLISNINAVKEKTECLLEKLQE